jgi:hypothetical protein
VQIPQSITLSESKTFAVCYAETDGSTTDSTWRDSYIRLQMSKIQSISSHLVTHTTTGQIASVSSLELTYAGSLGNNKWVSLVDSTLSSNLPCSVGTVAAASAGTSHSGVVQAGATDKVVKPVDTTVMSTAKTFAVCYTEAGGGTSATWIDTGIRLTLSKITSLQYGTPSRTMTSTNVAAAVNRLPQVANMKLTYVGDLAASKWVSLVDSALNGNNPCISAAIAASTADSTHSGVLQASASKVMTVPQTTFFAWYKVICCVLC